MRRIIERIEEEYAGLAWAFGKTANYVNTQRFAQGAGLHVRNVKKSDAGKHWQKGWAVMRIHGSKSLIDYFCDNNENGFREIKRGIGPAPTKP